MATFAADDIISTAGGDANGTYGYPKSGGEAFHAGNYFLSVMSASWGSRTIEVRVKDRSGNYVVPNDSEGNALTAKTANFAEIVSLGKSGIDLVMGGTGDADLTVTLEPWPY